MEEAFKPQYTAGYWAKLFFPIAPYFLTSCFYLHQLSTSREIAARFDLPYEGIGPASLVFVLLIGILVLLRIVSDIVYGYIRKIETNSEGIVFRRLLGKGISAEYQDLEWNDSTLSVSKTFSVYLGNIANRDAMKEFFNGQLAQNRETAENKPKEHRNRFTLWDDLKSLLFMVALCAFICFTILPWDSIIPFTDTAVWYADGVIALLLLIYAGFIIRKALCIH